MEITGKFSKGAPTEVDSTQDLLDVILGDQWFQQWMPDDVHRFWGSDGRFGTQVGKRGGREIVSTGQKGYLLFGPYVSLPTGQYLVVIRGGLGENGASGARMDVVVDRGKIILGESALANPDAARNLASLNISLDEPCTDLEVRVWVSDESDLQVSTVEIAPLRDDQRVGDPAQVILATGDCQCQDRAPIVRRTQLKILRTTSFTPADVALCPVEMSAAEVLLDDCAQTSDEVSSPMSMPLTSATKHNLKSSNTARDRTKSGRKKKR